MFSLRASEPRGKGVVPARTNVVSRQREFLQLSVCNFPTLSVDFLIETSFHLQPGGRCRAPDECKHNIEVTQRLASPVYAHVAEEPIFDRIPFRATRRIMT